MLESYHTPLPSNNRKSPPSSVTDKWSFVAIFLYFAMQPFNDSLHRVVWVGSFIDLLWAVILLALTLIYILSGKAFFWAFELKVVVLFTLYLGLHLLGSFVIALGGPDRFYDEVTALRWLLQSAPIFVLIVVRGMKTKELNAILTMIVLVMPFAILMMYRDFRVSSMQELEAFSRPGGGIPYNTFVPYTTFPVFAALYVIAKVRHKALAVPIICLLVFNILFIFASPSRQSAIFLVLGFLIVFSITKSMRKLILVAMVSMAIAFVLKEFDLIDQVTSRFFSSRLVETNRTDHMVNGLNEIRDAWEWFFGRSLTLALMAGPGFLVNPHNNYIFSVMRMGLFGMVLMFLPFVTGFVKMVYLTKRYGNQSWFDRDSAAFITVSLFFTLFHSFFGYPHLDALNAPIVWFGLALWIVYNRDLFERS